MKKSVLSALMAMGIVGATVAQNKVYDFPFNNSRAATVGTGSFSTGTTGFTTSRSGTVNGAYNQTGTGSVSSVSLPNLPIGRTARTISLWFNRQGPGNTTLFSYGTVGTSERRLVNMGFNSAGALYFYSGQTPLNYLSMGVPYNAWHHIALTYDESNVKIYFNGSFMLNLVVDLNTSAANFVLGDMVGYYDDLKIYEGALTATQITELYTNNEITTPSPVVAITPTPTTAGYTLGTGVYDNGDTVVVAARTNRACTFVNWTDNGNVVSTDSNYTFVLSGNKRLVANFTDAPLLYVPDVNFRTELLRHPNLDRNYDDKIQVYEAEDFTGAVYVAGVGATDITGIASFVGVTSISIFDNNIPTMDFSSNTALQTLYCAGNATTSLNISNCLALTQLSCQNNQLTSLDVSNNTQLYSLEAYDNNLTSLNIGANSILNTLSAQNNQLPSLDISAAPALAAIALDNNQLTNFSIAANPSVVSINLSSNLLTSFNAKNGNNTNISDYYFRLLGNPNLTCIEVDDSTWSEANWVNYVDAQATFRENCTVVPVGVNNAVNNSFTNIYPNPASTEIYLEVQAPIFINVSDLLGRKLISQNLQQGTNSINIQTLEAGVYIIQANDGSAVKFIKE